MENKSIHELLKKATEEEYFSPVMEEQHERALGFLKELGIIERGFSHTSGYYNRKESALAPDMEWTVGRSVLRVKLLLITEVLEEGEFSRKWENLGPPGLLKADPLARIVERAFDEFNSTVDNALAQRFDPNHPGFDPGNGSTRLWRTFHTSCVRPIDADRGFLRVLLFGGNQPTVLPDIKVTKTITTYLRFYKNDFPKPHGGGEDSVAL